MAQHSDYISSRIEKHADEFRSTCLKKAMEYLEGAIIHDNNQDYTEAFKLYRLALDYFMTTLKYEKDPKTKGVLRNHILVHMERAEALKAILAKTKVETPKETSVITYDLAYLRETEPSKLSHEEPRPNASEIIIHMEEPRVSWDEIIGFDNVKSGFEQVIAFRDRRKRCTNVLLVGPSTEDKELVAKAFATSMGARYFSISATEFPNETGIVPALFAKARETQPSVVFINDITSCGGFLSGAYQIDLQIALRECSEKVGVFFVGSTSTPWDFQYSSLKYFEKRLYVASKEESHPYTVRYKEWLSEYGL